MSLRMFDNLPPKEAIIKAWTDKGYNPYYHKRMQEEVRKNMPLLVRSIERLIEEEKKK